MIYIYVLIKVMRIKFWKRPITEEIKVDLDI
jgi:hypothetical protein